MSVSDPLVFLLHPTWQRPTQPRMHSGGDNKNNTPRRVEVAFEKMVVEWLGCSRYMLRMYRLCVRGVLLSNAHTHSSVYKDDVWGDLGRRWDVST